MAWYEAKPTMERSRSGALLDPIEATMEGQPMTTPRTMEPEWRPGNQALLAKVESGIHAAQMVSMPKEVIKQLIELRKKLRSEIQAAEVDTHSRSTRTVSSHRTQIAHIHCSYRM